MQAGLDVDLPGPARTRPRALGRSLRIVLLMPRTEVGGGARILLELANRLLDRGHAVTVLSHALGPTWFALRAPFATVPVGQSLAHAVPACDVVLAGYWELVPEVASLQIAPVVHVEQGDYHLFEPLPESAERRVRRALASADAHTAVTQTCADIMAERYGVHAEVVPNAVDPTVFSPAPHGTGLDTGFRRTVLAVGWDGHAFKGIDHVRAVAERLRTTHPDVDVVWVTPQPPAAPPGAVARVVVSPSQSELAALFRAADAYICASDYESFALPVMEAMSCGAPVVATRVPGTLEYCRDDENSLLVPTGDHDAMLMALTRILDDPELASRLSAAGLHTASRHQWDAVIDRAEAVYRQTAEAHAAGGDATAWSAVDGLEVLDRTDRAGLEALQAVQSRTGASRVLVPVEHLSAGGLRLMRWEVAHERQGGEGEVRVLVAHRRGAAAGAVDHHAIAEAFERGEIEAVLDAVAPALGLPLGRSTRGALISWAARCLVASDRARQALDLLRNAWVDHPDHPDLFRLAAEAARASNCPVDEDELAAVLAVLGRGSRYDEWLDPA